MTVTLKNGDIFKLTLPEPDVPWRRANREETYEKYAILMRDCPKSKSDDLFERVQKLEEEKTVDWMRI
jgi:hypothetical protein